MTDLAGQLADCQRRSERWEKNFSLMSNQCDKAWAERAALQEEITRLNRVLNAIPGMNASLTAELEKAQATVDHLTAKKRQAEQELADVRARAAEVRMDFAIKADQVAALRQAVQRLTAERDAMEGGIQRLLYDLTLGPLDDCCYGGSCVAGECGRSIEGATRCKRTPGMNQLTCLTCNTTVTSTHRHDFRSCACTDPQTEVCVDGGDAYDRRVFGPKAKWREFDGTMVDPEAIQARRHQLDSPTESCDNGSRPEAASPKGHE